jgi:hypothetical protein
MVTTSCFFFVSLLSIVRSQKHTKKNVKKYTADELLSEYPEYLRDSHVLIVSLLNIPLTHLLIFHLSGVLLRCELCRTLSDKKVSFFETTKRKAALFCVTDVLEGHRVVVCVPFFYCVSFLLSFGKKTPTFLDDKYYWKTQKHTRFVVCVCDGALYTRA